MARIRRLIVWCLGLVLLAGIGAGVYLYSLWAQSDEILRQQVLAGLHEAVPHCRFELDRAHFDFRRTVNLYGLTVYTGEDGARIAVLPKTVVTIDHELLAERQEVLVRKILFHRPEVALIRDESRQWNWEALIRDSPSEKELPEFGIEGGQLAVHLRSADAPPISVSLDGLEIQLIPAGFRQFLVQANTRIEKAGRLELKGRWDVDRGTGVGDGRWHELLADTALLRLIGTILPELDSQLHAVATPPVELLPPPPETIASPLAPNPF